MMHSRMVPPTTVSFVLCPWGDIAAAAVAYSLEHPIVCVTLLLDGCRMVVATDPSTLVRHLLLLYQAIQAAVIVIIINYLSVECLRIIPPDFLNCYGLHVCRCLVDSWHLWDPKIVLSVFFLLRKFSWEHTAERRRIAIAASLLQSCTVLCDVRWYISLSAALGDLIRGDTSAAGRGWWLMFCRLVEWNVDGEHCWTSYSLLFRSCRLVGAQALPGPVASYQSFLVVRCSVLFVFAYGTYARWGSDTRVVECASFWISIPLRFLWSIRLYIACIFMLTFLVQQLWHLTGGAMRVLRASTILLRS